MVTVLLGQARAAGAGDESIVAFVVDAQPSVLLPVHSSLPWKNVRLVR